MAKMEPKKELNGCFSILHNLNTMDTVVTDNDDMYTEENTSLCKSIHEFFAASVEKGKKICILENQNRLRNIKNQKNDEKNKLWGAFKKATRTQTGKNSEQKQGGDAAEAQSVKPEEAPKQTRVPNAVRIREATVRQKGPKPSKLAQELKEFQRQRKRHEMLVPISLTTLNSGKTRSVQALLDNGCTATCIDRDYAKAEGFQQKELAVHIIAKNADGTENSRGKITHYVELMMGIGPHQEKQRFLVTGLGKARVFIGYDWLLKHNPEIDWRSQEIKFSRCPAECNMKGEQFRTGLADLDNVKLEEGESILLVDFREAIDLRAKETQAQRLAEEAGRGREKMTEEKIPEQYRDFVKGSAKESFDSIPKGG